MDLESRSRWVEYSRAKDEMFANADIDEGPWWAVDGDVKKRARLNVISYLLTLISLIRRSSRAAVCASACRRFPLFVAFINAEVVKPCNRRAPPYLRDGLEGCTLV